MEAKEKKNAVSKTASFPDSSSTSLKIRQMKRQLYVDAATFRKASMKTAKLTPVSAISQWLRT